MKNTLRRISLLISAMGFLCSCSNSVSECALTTTIESANVKNIEQLSEHRLRIRLQFITPTPCYHNKDFQWQMVGDSIVTFTSTWCSAGEPCIQVLGSEEIEK